MERAGRYRPAIRLGEKVPMMRRADGGRFTITTDASENAGRSVLITAGIGMFQPRWLTGLLPFGGGGLLYFVKQLEPYRGKRVLVIGGGDSGVDWALNLEPLASNVPLIYRRSQFRAHEDSLSQLLSSRITVKTPYELRDIQGAGEVELAVISHTRTQEEETLTHKG